MERQTTSSSFSLSSSLFDEHDDEQDSSLFLPSPPPMTKRHFNTTRATSRTPLVARHGLFTNENLESRQEYKLHHDQRGIADYLFGFMKEEPYYEQELQQQQEAPSVWSNQLNRNLFVAYGLTCAAASIPVSLISFVDPDFGSRAAASSVLGTACGKFLNGPMGDVFGARRVYCVYAMGLALSLMGLSTCSNTYSAGWALFFVEFFQSVSWPCIIVILATHFQNNKHDYEGGIYVTCLSSRLGSLLAIPLSLLLLKCLDWRLVAQCGALLALGGALTMYVWVQDSPTQTHCPQNPISQKRHGHFLLALLKENMIPSLRNVLKRGTFWIVAIAHTGATMVRSSERILGTYFYNTTTLSKSRAGGLAIVLDFGILVGLGVGGGAFANKSQHSRQRKRLVARLYMLSIASCYVLALLAIPKINALGSVILWFQIVAVFCAGVGVAVQCFCIPGIVGATFGHNKGLYAAYTDGVAYGLGSVVWRIVAGAVQEGNPRGGGWAYGWAAVALLVVLCAVLMVEFMEHYFCRSCRKESDSKDGYETIIFV